MIYSPRLKKILQICLSEDGYIKVDTLAVQLKTSKRTIFREMKDVDQDLASYGLQLISKQGKGISIQGEETQKEALRRELKVTGIAYLNKEERQNLMIFELLRNDEVTKLIHYANLFQVSEATISTDIDVIEPWFMQYDLKLLRKPGMGVTLEGEESDIRNAMTVILNRTLLKNQSYGNINYLDTQSLLQKIFLENENESIMRLLNQDILERILQVFQTYQHELNLDRYAQPSYIGLIIHLVIAIDRIMKQEAIQRDANVLAMVKDDACFAQAKAMAEYLEMEFDIEMPEVEIAFIALHIKGAKFTGKGYSQEQLASNQDLLVLIDQLLNAYDEETAFRLRQDEELQHGLIAHLGPTLTRLQHHLSIYNPLLSQIKQEYAALYEQTKLASEVLEKAAGCKISEDEIGFITMHIGASLERSSQQQVMKRQVSLGVVCASGIGVSSLLAARIHKAFPNQTKISILSIEDILSHRYDHCEFLISTLQLDVRDRSVLEVTPLLNDQDTKRLGAAIQQAADMSYHDENHATLNSFAQLQMMQKMINITVSLLHTLQSKVVEETINVEETIAFSAQHLGEEDEQQAIAHDLKKRQELESCIFPQLGFALLHAKTTVKNSKILLLYPRMNCFRNMEEIKFIVILLMPSHAERLQQEIISIFSRSILEHEEFMEALQQQNLAYVTDLFSGYVMDYMQWKLEEEGDDDDRS